MKIYHVMLLASISLWACTSSAQDGGSVYSFVGTPLLSVADDGSVNHALGRVTIDLSERTVTIQDAVFPLNSCSANDKFYCLFGGGLAFSLQKSGSADQKWSCNGFDFENLGTQDIPILGQHHEVMIISARRHGDSSSKTLSVSYYSKTEGLLGFTIQDGEATDMYLLKGGIGYAANR